MARSIRLELDLAMPLILVSGESTFSRSHEVLSSVVEQEFMVTKKPFDPEIFLSVVGKGKTVSEYRKDQVIFAQGDVADSIYYLQRGRVKVVVLSEQGKEAVVGLIEAGQFFWQGCMNGQ